MSFGFASKQLRNARHRLRKQSRGGYTPFQLMMKHLDEKEIPYQVLWAENSSSNEGVEMRKPEGLFWTTSWCEQQWVRYPWVQMYDNTYKTNNKGPALFQIVGRNHLGMSFSCGLGWSTTRGKAASTGLWIPSTPRAKELALRSPRSR